MIIRRATLDDREAITRLIAESARGLSRGHYSDPQIDAAIVTVFGVDTNLIEDGTYFVAEISGTLVGCGGWSRRKTLFGGDQYSARDAGYLDPECEAAKIRAFFIHPDHRIQRTTHPHISDIRSTARQDPIIGCLHMRVRSKNDGSSPVQVPTHRTLFRCRLSMHIHDNDA